MGAEAGIDDIDEPRQTLSGESTSKSHVRYNPEGAFRAACAAQLQQQRRKDEACHGATRLFRCLGRIGCAQRCAPHFSCLVQHARAALLAQQRCGCPQLC